MSKSVKRKTGSSRAEHLKPHWFKPGQSGNPSGRSKKRRDIETKAAESAEEAINILAKLLKSKDERVALSAAQALLDRGVGKPTEKVDVKADVSATVDQKGAIPAVDAIVAKAQADREEHDVPGSLPN